jgi:hypothetical protein
MQNLFGSLFSYRLLFLLTAHPKNQAKFTIMNKVLILLLAVVLSSAYRPVQQYSGTNLRGKIVQSIAERQAPLGSARIDLYHYESSKWKLIATTITDAYGFYYFKNIAPAYYSVQVNQRRNYNIQVVTIDYSRYSYQDLPLFSY